MYWSFCVVQRTGITMSETENAAIVAKIISDLINEKISLFDYIGRLERQRDALVDLATNHFNRYDKDCRELRKIADSVHYE